MRKKWGDVVSVLKDKRFDEIVNQYSCFSHEIGISALVGILVCLIAWGLQLTPLLENYPFYQVLIYGLAAGLSGCGFYDVIKAIGGLFKNKED